MSGLYIHIPFCKSKCIYCDFYSTPSLGDIERVVDGLIVEFEQRRDEVDSDIRTIYIGGGTPSVVPADILRRLIEHLPLERCEEFTIEANPDDITPELVAAWRTMGINRVSMGIQSLDDAILRTIRRRHSAEQALAAIAMLCKGGIQNISCDLIYGLPGLSDEIWRNSLTRLLSEPISHLSAYCLTYNEGTPLYDMMLRGQIVPASDEEIESQFAILREVSSAQGFEHYEISNFARPGMRSRHNSSYWQPDSSWLGIGPSAHSFDGLTRRIDVANTYDWLRRLPAPFDIDEETPLDRINDIIVTSLRTTEGLDLSILDEATATSILRDARKFLADGSMTLVKQRLSIDQSHWLISDAFIRDLIRV